MKYFTDEKLQNSTAHSEYEEYCESIWSELPIDLKFINEGMLPESMIDLEKSIGLHDARITRFDLIDNNSILEIDLNADNSGCLRRVFMEYINPNILKDIKPERKGSEMDSSYSDVMCHEISINDNGLYSHLLLFASGEQLEIEFEDFRMGYSDGS